MKIRKKTFYTRGEESFNRFVLLFFLLNLCILYLGLLETECAIEGMEGLFVYQVSAAEDKFTPVTYRRQLGVMMCNNV